MGVDIALDETPHDRFAEAQTMRPPQDIKRAEAPRAVAPMQSAEALPARAEPRALSRPLPREAAPVPEAIVQSARDAAAAATSLEDLRDRLAAFGGCALRETATQLVFADGNPRADVMFVGEAPGAEEDRMGRPFVGRAGQLLDKMLASIDLDRTKVYIANIVPWRPPGNRTPTPVEAAACLPFTRRQIELVNPKILICLGAPSMQTLLEVKEGIMRVRGKWLSYKNGERDIPAMAMLHPAYLLRTPAQKKLAWQDLRLLAKQLAKTPEKGT
jgi:DNA polymerase